MYFDFSFASSTIYVFIALLIVLFALFYKGVHKAMAKALDERAEKIKNELEEARRLREEAEDLLASYKRKQAEAEEQAAGIVAQAKREAEILAENARKDLAERLKRRADQAEAKIKMAEMQAINDVKKRAANIASLAVQDLLEKELSKTDHTKLIKQGIAELGKTLH